MGQRETQIDVALKELTTYDDKIISWQLKGEMFTDEETVPILNIKSLVVDGDFVQNYADVSILTITMKLSTYSTFLLRNRRKMKIRLIRSELGDSGTVISGGKVEVSEFDAVPLVTIDPSIWTKGRTVGNADEDDIAQQLMVPFQLIPSIVSEMRLQELSGIYREVNQESLLRLLMGYGLEDKQGTDDLKDNSYQGVRGVDIVPIDNRRIIETLIVPIGTRLVNLPFYLQNKAKGLYQTGCARFFHAGFWYIYPPWNHTRFPKAARKLNVFIVPKDQAMGINNTYYVKGGVVTIFVTGQVANLDNSEKALRNYGNGFSFSSAGELLDGFVDTKNGITKPRTETNRKEVVAYDHPTEIQNIRQQTVFTDNPFKISSDVSKALGRVMQVMWENAAPSLIVPGMAVKVNFMKEGLLGELYGTVIGRKYMTTTDNDKLLNDNYRTNMTLQFHLGIDQ